MENAIKNILSDDAKVDLSETIAILMRLSVNSKERIHYVALGLMLAENKQSATA